MCLKKRYYCLLYTILLFASYAQAQQRFGNEWIKFSQPYLKVSTSANGFYRLTFTEIRQAGLTFDASQVARLQLFHRGTEVALNVTTDYIEFYGEANNGGQDSLLYRPYSARPHSYQNLYGDVTHYFLTVGTSNGLRMEQVKNISATGLLPETYHLEKQRQVFTSDYSFNNFPGPVPALQQSFYEPGEGWTGGFIKSDSLAVWTVQLQNRVKNGVVPQFKILLNGRSDFYHNILASVGKTKADRKLFDTKIFNGYSQQVLQVPINQLDMNTDDSFVFSLQSVFKDNFELYSLSLHEVVYPQNFDMAGQMAKYFWLIPNKTGRSLVNIQNAPANAQVYDFSNTYQPKILESQRNGNTLTVAIPNTETARTLWVTSNTALKPIIGGMVNFVAIDPKSFDYCIVAHKTLLDGATAYANYRASAAGGNYKVKVVDIQDIINQFGYGELHPVGLRRFADFITAADSRPYLFLVGRPYTFPDFLKTTTDNLVPSIGYPGSDILLTAGLANERPDVPALPTGRLAVTKNEEILAYLEKVKTFEAQPKGGLWRKNLLHLSGGKTTFEIEYLRDILQSLVENAGKLGSQVAAQNKSAPVEVENINISGKVNDGLSMITFFGHSSPTTPDLNMGYASAVGNGLANQPKFPFMYFNGCAAGNVFFRYNPISTDWLITPQKGAIAVMANSYWSFPSSSERHLQLLYKTMFANRTMLGVGIGKIHQEVNRQMAAQGLNEYDVANLHQVVLQGDPAVVVLPMTKPDYEAKATGIFVQSNNAPATLEKTETVQVGAILSNAGMTDPTKKINVKVQITFDTKTTQQSFTISEMAYQDTLLFAMKREGKIQKIEVTIDPDKQIDELDENNNAATLDIDWSKAANTVSYPVGVIPDKLPPAMDVWIDGKKIKSGAFVANSPTVEVLLQDDSPLNKIDSTHIEVFLKKCEKCSFEKIPNKLLSVQNQPITSLKATLKLEKLSAGNYELLVTGRDARRNAVGQPYQISFTVVGQTEASVFRIFPNPSTDFVKIETQVKSPTPPSSIWVQVVDLQGRILSEFLANGSVGETSSIWGNNASSGVYVAKVKLLWPSGVAEEYQQKFVLKK